jgi:hypothetical protein
VSHRYDIDIVYKYGKIYILELSYVRINYFILTLFLA